MNEDFAKENSEILTVLGGINLTGIFAGRELEFLNTTVD